MSTRGIAQLGLLWLLFSTAAVAAERGPGPAFSDPGQSVQGMPEHWAQQPVVRKDWAQGADLAVTLDQHLYPALLPLIREFGAARDLNIAVQEGTCGISAGQLETKNADIGGFCCPAGVGDRLPGLRFHTLGIAALGILKHPSNPVSGLASDQVRSLFAGDAAFWGQLDERLDPRALIRPVGRLHCKARPGHWRLILDRDEDFSPRLEEVSTIPDMVAAVAENPQAIGYEVLWMTRRYREIGLVRAVPVDGVAPTDQQALVEGRYPFYRTFNITTWVDAAAEPAAAALAEYLKANFERVDPVYGLISAQRLREAGWGFDGDELIRSPSASPAGSASAAAERRVTETAF